MVRVRSFLVLVAILSATAIAAEPISSWPGFRGPNGSGVALQAKPPLQIGPGQSVLWECEVPDAPSSPCIWGDRIILTTHVDGKLETRGYDRSRGKLLWTQVAPAEKLEDFMAVEGSPAASTPTTDGEVVVSYFGSAGLFAYDLSGKELWRHALPVAQTHGGFGSGTSPILVGDRVILSRDLINEPVLLALDRKTGRKLWETPRPGSPTGYGTPIVWEHNGTLDLVVGGSVTLKGFDPKSGAERWVVRGLPAVGCTTPVLGDGLLFFAGWSPGKADAPFPTWASRLAEWDKNGDGTLTEDEFGWGPQLFRSVDNDKNGRLEAVEWQALIDYSGKGENVALAIKPGGTGDVTDSHVAWKVTRGLPYVPSPLYFESRLYLVKDGGLISCLNARTGEAIYSQERIPDAAGNYYASPVAADGRIYVASLEGKITVLKAGEDKPVVLHQSNLGERIAATPAIVDRRIYLRTNKRLLAFGS